MTRKKYGILERYRSIFIQFWKDNYNSQDIRDKLEAALENVSLFESSRHLTKDSARRRIDREPRDICVSKILQPDEIKVYRIQGKGETFTVQIEISVKLSILMELDFYDLDMLNDVEFLLKRQKKIKRQKKKSQKVLDIQVPDIPIFLDCKIEETTNLKIQKVFVNEIDIRIPWRVAFGGLKMSN